MKSSPEMRRGFAAP